MSRLQLARTLLTFNLIVGAISSFILDWSPNHLLHPAWHPHARFHGALLLFFLAGVSALGLWILWRTSQEPEFAIKVTALLSSCFWLPLFYIPFLLPSSSWWAGEVGKEPRYFGYIIYPNLVVSAIFLFVSVISFWLARSGENSTKQEIRNSQFASNQVS